MMENNNFFAEVKNRIDGNPDLKDRVVKFIETMPIPSQEVIELSCKMQDTIPKISEKLKKEILEQSEAIWPTFKEAYDNRDDAKMSIVSAGCMMMGKANLSKIGIELPECMWSYLNELCTWSICLMQEIGMTADELKEINKKMMEAA